MQGWRDEVIAVKHFARNLCIPGFVCAHQSEIPQAIKEEKGAQGRNRKHLNRISQTQFLSFVHAAVSCILLFKTSNCLRQFASTACGLQENRKFVQA
jgi:hypothetical protein